MFTYGLSRKQCGVIFANIKNGNLSLADDFASWMYARVADARVFSDDTKTSDVFAKMRNGLDAVFAGDLSAANDSLSSAYNVYHAFYKN